MSLFPRLVLALVTALFGIMMIGIAPPTDKAVFFHAFGAFCLAITGACLLRGRIAQFFGSVVGLAVFGMGVAYVVSMLAGGPYQAGRRSEPSALNALLFMAIFGAPAAAYVWYARFGFARRGKDAADLPDANGPSRQPSVLRLADLRSQAGRSLSSGFTKSAVDTVIESWRSAGVPLQPGVDDEAIRVSFAAIGREVSADVVELYARCNGMSDGESDQHFFSWWPIEQCIQEGAQCEPPFIPFADFMISSHLYVLRFETPERSSVWACGHSNCHDGVQVAGSVEEFFSCLLCDPEKVHAWQI